ncbi:MAG: hypothetical protein ACPG5W_07175, partial [Flavobacteriales bacterium]
MNYSVLRFLLVSIAIFGFSSAGFSQDDDGIYGDIYETSDVEQEVESTEAPLDGYSTVDDYYPEGGTDQQTNSAEPYSEQYVDENGNNVTNNYYGDY